MLTLSQIPDTFPDALRFLRKRARLTQDELGRTVGYSREQIARLENGSRLPDLAVIAALFVPALFEPREQHLAEQLLALAGQTRRGQQITITHTRQTRLEVTSEPLPVLAAPTHRPPAPLLPIIGREREVADLLALLEAARLVTVVGAPGIGKSRLALEAANRASAGFTDGAAFVPLADVTAAADVPYAFLRALGVTPAPQQTVEAAIAAYLVPRRLLLVADNCEHILDAAPRFADWLASAPGVKLLCTSRVPLDIYGEHEWPLAPLTAPNLAEPPDLARWGQCPAMQLLVARGRAIDPAFTLTADNLLPLATLCAALDGLPLALELAAVRLRDLSPGEVVQQLLTARGHGHLSSTWLQQTRRNIAERHRTLQAAIDWSVRMLPPAQAAAFYHLGVFAGGCSEAAAQAVVDVTTAGAGPDVLAALARANLVARAAGRVTLLETLRAYAVERLAAAGDLAAGRRSHAAYFVAFGKQVFDGLLGDDQTTWMQAALADHDNFLAALRWALAAEDGETAIALAGNLWWFWYRRGLFALGQELLGAALRLVTPDRSARARALNGLASIHLALDNPAASLACHREGLALRRELNDPLGIATALHNMGLTAYVLGDFAQAIAWMHESIAADPTADPAQAWAHIGIISLDMLDLAESRRWLERAYASTQGAPAGWLHAFVAFNLADTLWECGERGAARQLAEASLRQFETLGDEHYTTDPRLLLARAAVAEGDFATAHALSARALAEYEAQPDPAAAASARLVQAELTLAQGDAAQAVALAAAALAQRRRVARPLSPREEARYGAVLR
jgi:predicted ATPase/DNA-binding XRE family transcriptional regulator